MSKCFHCNKWFLSNESKCPVLTQPGRMAHSSCVSRPPTTTTTTTQTPSVPIRTATIPQHIPRYTRVPRNVQAPLQPSVPASAPAQLPVQSVPITSTLPAAPSTVAILRRNMTTELTCCMCLDEKPSFSSFAPCMHSTCTDCAKALIMRSRENAKCPSCRTPIKGVHRNHQLENMAIAWNTYSALMEDMLARASTAAVSAPVSASVTAPAPVTVTAPKFVRHSKPLRGKRPSATTPAVALPVSPTPVLQFHPLNEPVVVESPFGSPFIFGTGNSSPTTPSAVVDESISATTQAAITSSVFNIEGSMTPFVFNVSPSVTPAPIVSPTIPVQSTSPTTVSSVANSFRQMLFSSIRA